MSELPNLKGYMRPNGTFGIRNFVAVVAAADNVNPVIYHLKKLYPELIAIPATFGRGQLGEDFEITLRSMAAICSHPNLFGCLVISFEPDSALRIADRVEVLGRSVKWLSLLEVGGFTQTVHASIEILQDMFKRAAVQSVEAMPVSSLCIGLECGGSDATSGLIANPAIGIITDEVISMGGTAVFSEPVELLGCDTQLGQRARTSIVAGEIARVVEKYRDIALRAGIDLTGTNPTPDNMAGGLSTIEEKSLGAIAKTGSMPIEGVLEYGVQAPKPGLWLSDAPAAAVENCTALVTSWCQLILFGTGSVNPVGHPIAPTIKICANPLSSGKMREHIDVDLSAAISGDMTLREATGMVNEKMLSVIHGQKTCCEVLDYGESRVSRFGLSV